MLTPRDSEDLLWSTGNSEDRLLRFLSTFKVEDRLLRTSFKIEDRQLRHCKIQLQVHYNKSTLPSGVANLCWCKNATTQTNAKRYDFLFKGWVVLTRKFSQEVDTRAMPEIEIEAGRGSCFWTSSLELDAELEQELDAELTLASN